MALVIDDRVRETTTVTGTNDATLLGAVTGFQAFSVIGNGNTTYYTISDQSGGNWEVGIGTYSSIGPTLERTTVLTSSNSGSKVSFPAGTKDVFVTYPSDKAVYLDASGDVQPALGTVNATTVDTTNLEVTNLKAKDGTSAGSIANSTGVVTLASSVLTTTDINGGTIDGTVIGGSTAAAGTFTQVDITAQGDLRLQDTTGGEYVALQAPSSLAGSYTLTLPVDDGTSGQALITDGSGVLSWSTAASGDVYGPASATDDAIARFDGTTGKIIQNSAVTISDTTGSLNFTATGARITGDFSNATLANRVYFQTSTTNGNTTVPALPNGTANQSQFLAYNGTDPANSGLAQMLCNTAEMSVRMGIAGTGTYLPMTFHTGGSERLRIDTSGNVGIGISIPVFPLQVLRTQDTDGNILVLDNLSTAGRPSLSVRADIASAVLTSAGSTWSGAEALGRPNGIALFTGGTSTGGISIAARNAAGIITLHTGGNDERMRIDSSGKVGIAVSANLTALLNFPQADSGEVINIFSSPTEANRSGIGKYPGEFRSYVPAADFFSWIAGGPAGTERMRITGSGNVGIGTTSPSSFGRLVVSSSTASNSTITDLALQANRSYSTSNNGLAIVASASNGTLGTHDFGAITFNESPTSNGGSSFVNMYAGGSSSAFDNASRFLRASSPAGVGIDHVALWTGSAERMRIDSSGNVGIGTSTPAGSMQLLRSSDPQFIITDNGTSSFSLGTTTGYSSIGTDAAAITFKTGVSTGSLFSTGSERMRIDSSGNVLIGTTAVTAPFTVNLTGSGGTAAFRHNGANSFGTVVTIETNAGTDDPTLSFKNFNGGSPTNYGIAGTDDGALAFKSGASTSSFGTERMRIDSSGQLLVGLTTAAVTANIQATTTGTDSNIFVRNTTATTGYFLWGNANGTDRLFCAQTGSITNATGTYGTISDAKLKENIVDATPKLDKVMQLQVRNFNFINDELKQIGFIAQEIEQVFPSLVEEHIGRDEEGNENGDVTKSVKTSILLPILVKAIQELKATVDAQAARIAALESK
jgi:hypothetical protein